MNRIVTVMLGGILLLLISYVCSCSEFLQPERGISKQGENIKVVVVTGGHGFKQEPFLALFQSYDDIDYVEARQQDHSEIFEDISDWDYDVIVLYNMTQQISPKRRQNFVRLLQRGVGVVALHHSIAAYQQWSEYRKIIGGKYYLKTAEENGLVHEAGTYKHDVDFMVHIEDASHPITQGMSDFTIYDETYRKCVFDKDNLVLASTDHPTSDGPLCWVKRYGRAKICYIQMGDGPSAYADANYRRLVARAIKWCAGRLDGN